MLNSHTEQPYRWDRNGDMVSRIITHFSFSCGNKDAVVQTRECLLEKCTNRFFLMHCRVIYTRRWKDFCTIYILYYNKPFSACAHVKRPLACFCLVFEKVDEQFISLENKGALFRSLPTTTPPLLGIFSLKPASFDAVSHLICMSFTWETVLLQVMF